MKFSLARFLTAVMAVISDTAWLLTYFPVAWLAHACQGLAMGILGPLQPFLALKVGVNNSYINFIWTLRAVGSCLATVATGFIFKRFVRTKNQKLSFLGGCVLLVGLFIGLVPFTSSFYLMLLGKNPSPSSGMKLTLPIPAIMLAGVFLGCLDTASNSLVVWMLGPDRSPPFTQSLHAMVAMGFVLGSLIVRPFLPSREQDRMICDRLSQDNLSLISNSHDGAPTAQQDNLQLAAQSLLPLGWPFFIICFIHSFTALAYLALSNKNN